MRRVSALICIAAGLCAAQEGTKVYIAHCQQCHDQNSDAHAPLREALASRPWEQIVKALETGSMRAQGAQLSPEERRAVARYLGKAGPAVLSPMTGYCAAGVKPKPTSSSWNGWSTDNRNTRFQPAKAAGLTAEQVPSLKLAWAFGFPDAVTAYGQPTVVDGRVYSGSNDGTVYALDARTGCLYWMYQAKAMVRDAVIVGPGARAYFGDLESNFYALDAHTGKLIWQRKLDDQPFTRITGTAKLYDGRLYVPIASQEENAGANPFYSCCTFRGNLVALKASDGSEIWRTFTSPEAKPTWKSAAGVQYYGPSGATIWSSPTLDLKRKLIYAATGNGYSGPNIETADAIVAMDMDTGAIRWTKQANPDMFNWDCGGQGAQGPQKGNCPDNAGTDVDFGASPILVDLDGGHRMLVAGQKSAVVWGFDPDQQGKVVWQTRIGKGGPGGGIQWGIAYSPADKLVFAPLADAVRGDPASGGGLFALDAATGKLVWHTPPPKPSCSGKRGCSSAQRSPPTVIPGVVFSPSMDGHIRAFQAKTGEIVWDFDAVREYTTVNGIPARGGSFSATGPTVVDGMLYANSGYSSMPGNVLLAFSAPAAPTTPASKTLDFYTIDVEGGKSVLIVSPSGESMLFDVGWPRYGNRESSVDRIVATVKAAGLKQIDYLVISHFDLDHLGDVPQLVSKIPVRHIYDHGEFQPSPGADAAPQRFKAYDEVRRRIGYTVVKPGDKIPIKGVSVEVVAAGGKFIKKPLKGAGAPNPLCAANPQAAVIPRDVEDNLSVGLLFTLGKFRMLDLADLEAHHNHELVCPNNLIGTVDVYHVNVHGQFKGMSPELIGAVRPRVAILGNGASKGADPPSWPILRATPGLEDIWQDHYSVAGTKDTNPPEDFIANIEPIDGGQLIKLSAESNGTFTVTNTRNGFSKTCKGK